VSTTEACCFWETIHCFSVDQDHDHLNYLCLLSPSELITAIKVGLFKFLIYSEIALGGLLRTFMGSRTSFVKNISCIFKRRKIKFV
jgi:hypothetical protein